MSQPLLLSALKQSTLPFSDLLCLTVSHWVQPWVIEHVYHCDARVYIYSNVIYSGCSLRIWVVISVKSMFNLPPILGNFRLIDLLCLLVPSWYLSVRKQEPIRLQRSHHITYVDYKRAITIDTTFVCVCRRGLPINGLLGSCFSFISQLWGFMVL